MRYSLPTAEGARIDPSSPRATRTGTDLAWLASIALGVLAVLLSPFLRQGYRFGLGSDIPVYLWWARVGAAEGLSLVGGRPGAPALIAVLAGGLRLPIAAVTAGLEAALGAAVATAMAMLVRAANAMAGERRGARAAWILGGSLAGLFSVHLAAGYLANLVFAAAFIAAAVCLATGTRRGAAAAAILLGGGGLAHPQFFLVGVAILAAVAGWSLARRERGWSSDAGRVAIAALGAGAAVGAGLASMAIGPARLAVDTSKDGFLRRAGLSALVRDAYTDRAIRRWARYVQWLSVPLAALGLMRTSGFARRVLAAWTALVVIGAPIGLLTGWYPPDRLITFGFAIPALAGVGAAAVWSWFGRRAWLGVAAATMVVGLMAAGALIAWSRQRPFVSTLEVAQVTAAGRIAAASSAPGTPLVFIVDDADATASFLAIRAANVIRAAVPPERAADVYVYVGTPKNFFDREPTLRGNPEYNTLSRLFLSDIPDRRPVVFLLTSFDRDPRAIPAPGLFARGGGVYSSAPQPTDAGADELAPDRDPLEPSSPGQIVLAAGAILALTAAVGYPWARWAGLDGPAAIGVAPGFGVATLVLGGVAADRLGLSLAGGGRPTIVALVAAGVGVALLVVQGKPTAPPSAGVEE